MAISSDVSGVHHNPHAVPSAPVMTRSLLVPALLLLSCTTVPRDPGAPTSAERPLVETARRWCQEAGLPAGEPTRPFYSDGCSAWPDGDLYTCCLEHDIAYWCGGSEEDRRQADRRLQACADVQDPGQSGLVYAGVRVGGAPWLPLPWRWGYGHPYGSGYSDSSSDSAGSGSPASSGP